MSDIRNCIIVGRNPGDRLIVINNDGTATVRLDGYVICPRELLLDTALRYAIERAADNENFDAALLKLCNVLRSVEDAK